jgi:cytochrome c553
MAAEGSFVASPASGLKGFAPGYMDAMHGLCTACHRKKSKENPDEHRADLAECSACHRDPDAIPFHRMQPYLASGAQR